MAGLGNGDSSTAYGDIEFAWHLTSTGTLAVVESGTVIRQVGTYAVDDLLEVRLNSQGKVEYVHNKAVAYTSTRNTPLPLCVDTSFYEAGELKEVQWLMVSERGAVQWVSLAGASHVRTAPGSLKKLGSAPSKAQVAVSLLHFESIH